MEIGETVYNSVNKSVTHLIWEPQWRTVRDSINGLYILVTETIVDSVEASVTPIVETTTWI